MMAGHFSVFWLLKMHFVHGMDAGCGIELFLVLVPSIVESASVVRWWR